MPASSSQADPTIGFLSVADLAGGALIGGYLILNTLGRPLEFHCTEPVKPNRAQQILYGATLESYLEAEQIGQTLFGNSELRPSLLVTDRPAMVTLRRFVESPVVCLASPHHSTGPRLDVQIGSACVWLSERDEADVQRVQHVRELLQPDWDLAEPFERIHEAITELQKAA